MPEMNLCPIETTLRIIGMAWTATTVSTTNTSYDIKTKVSRISDLLAEAISSRISKER
jgi:DNA-binding HxlR family transcriptional regulator